jgi:2'-5' RNA ligase
MRLFVAIALPEIVREQLSLLQRGLKEARWINPENLHLTLRFLGELDGRQASDVDAGLTALRGSAFPLGLCGIDHFGDGRKVRALWTGVADPEPVMRLQAKVERAVQLAGIPSEARKFKPHVTLARFKKAPGPGFADYLHRNALFRCEPFIVNEIVLYSSLLTRDGSLYRPEAHYPLAGAPTVEFSSFEPR